MAADLADRIIIASAIMECLTLITTDKPMLSFAKTIGLDYIQG